MKSDINATAKAMLVGGRYLNVLTVDPGLGGTGLALWDLLTHSTGVYAPRWTKVIHKPHSTICHGWQEACYHVAGEVVRETNGIPDHVFIEVPRLWATAKSRASASRGDLTKLSMLVGAIMQALYVRGYPMVKIVTAFPSDWKGQLPKKVVLDRIEQALGRRYRDHEADAVGMGLAIQGVL